METVTLDFNPFDIVIVAYKQLYDKPCNISFVMNEDESEPLGYTEFDEDEKEIPRVCVDIKCTIRDAVEVLAHELAHVAAGYKCAAEDSHGTEWLKCFSAIHEKYNEIVISNVPEGMKVV